LWWVDGCGILKLQSGGGVVCEVKFQCHTIDSHLTVSIAHLSTSQSNPISQRKRTLTKKAIQVKKTLDNKIRVC